MSSLEENRDRYLPPGSSSRGDCWCVMSGLCWFCMSDSRKKMQVYLKISYGLQLQPLISCWVGKQAQGHTADAFLLTLAGRFERWGVSTTLVLYTKIHFLRLARIHGGGPARARLTEGFESLRFPFVPDKQRLVGVYVYGTSRQLNANFYADCSD